MKNHPLGPAVWSGVDAGTFACKKILNVECN